MSRRSLMKSFVPPVLLPILRWWGGASFKGDYTSWDNARLSSKGYCEDETLDAIIEASRRVRDGDSAYERDGSLFDSIEYSWPMLAGLMTAAAKNGGTLRALDFGGSLGSSYRQNMAFLGELSEVSWAVVETPKLVNIALSEFQTNSLRFFDSLDAAYQYGPYNVVIFASVLPYLPDPYDILKEAIERSPDYIILDRTMVLNAGTDRLTVQTNSASIGSGSYPAWFLSESRLKAVLESEYRLVADFDALGGQILLRAPYARSEFKGYIFRKRGK